MPKNTHLRAAQIVQKARANDRPTARNYIHAICDDFFECHGDRAYQDDPAIIGGLGRINGQTVTIVATEKGQNLSERQYHNFGSPHPEGYRKAIRLYKQAAKFNRPVLNFIDTAGAYCDDEAENRGIGQAISEALATLADLPVFSLGVIVGEAGSGGALALCACNQIWMLDDATFSVLSPEGFAAILWKDAKLWREASEVMKLTAKDLQQLNVIDRQIYSGGSKTYFFQKLKKDITQVLQKAKKFTPAEIQQQRYFKYRNY